MLQLGLQRISQLVTASELPWRAIHVAGTNGKGSVCAYASSMLKAAGLPVGRFTSPHFLDRWDCINVHGQPIEQALFHQIEHDIRQKDRRLNLDATEFELLTAIAFEAFTHAEVDVGVIEVGLGGRLDATNVLKHPLATVITRIGIDHQSLLGNNIGEIATEKAGIMKRGVPCFVDSANQAQLDTVIQNCAKNLNAGPLEFVGPDGLEECLIWDILARYRYAPHQQVSIALAYRAVKSALTQKRIKYRPEDILPAVESTTWRGRLENLDVSKVVPRSATVLLDGAHNPQAARALRHYVEAAVKQASEPKDSHVTWVLAISEGKQAAEIAAELVRDGDRVITTQFGPVDGMPWVSSMEPSALLEHIVRMGKQYQYHNVVVRAEPRLESALRTAAQLADEGPLVVAGSLYLAADVTRLLQS